MTVLLRSLLLLLAGCVLSAQAADTGWLRNAQNSHAEVRLRAAPQAGDTRLLLDIHLEPGWKTYWRTPGEGGVAPAIAWQTPGISAQWFWPVPARFDVSGLTTQGYKGTVTLPIVLQRPPGSDTLTGTLTLSTCSDVCILTDFAFSLDLTRPAAAAFDRDFARAMGQVPPDSGLTDQLNASFVNGELQIRAVRQAGWSTPALFFDYPAGSMLAAPVISVQGNTLSARVAVTDEWGDAAPDLRGRQLSLVISDKDLAQQSHVTLGAEPLLSGGTRATLWSVLLLALLGGLVLNLMPCVLPVMAIKLSGLVQQQGQTRRQTRLQFLASSAGILFSFLLLALLMSALRLSGQALGWGIQFQSSGFLLLMTGVMFLFSASLFDLLHLRLPSAFNTRLATHQGNGLAGHFAQGAFATLLATPCSAPFLGTAVAYALTAPLPQLWLLFAALGIGMSVPWLLVAALPGVARWLPRPGRWMVHLRTLLGILMLLATLWLVTLLIPHWGRGAAGLLAAALLLLLLTWLLRRRALQQAGAVAITLTIAGALFLLMRPAEDAGELHWQPLSEQAIAAALQQNRRVFVDITADWCITCKVNKSRVLNQPDVRAALSADDIVLLRGDWTQPDPAIGDFLRQRDWAAIPFNQIYGPALPQGQILSPLLSRDAVLSTLSKAKK